METAKLDRPGDELQAALDRLAQRIHDPQAARKSRERMDRMREDNRKRASVFKTLQLISSVKLALADELRD